MISIDIDVDIKSLGEDGSFPWRLKCVIQSYRN